MVPNEAEAGSEDDVRSWWLVRLRWGWVAGQGLIILGASQAVHLDLPLRTLLALTTAMAASNALLHLWLARRGGSLSRARTGALLAFDMAQLTALLYVSGGASNPFSVFYLVHITAAAATLGSRWTWLLSAFGVSAYAALFALPLRSTAEQAMHAGHNFESHLRAMWIALTLAAALTAFFVTRLTRSLAAREREILVMREAAARRDRLSAVTTLAAGAAHELATPLMTVGIVAAELESSLAALPDPRHEHLLEDVRLIRGEVVRCRDILDEIGLGSGAAAGEMPARFSVGELVRDVLGRLRQDVGPRVLTAVDDESAMLVLPRRAVSRVVWSLVQNGLDATPAGGSVRLHIATANALVIAVRDEGAGLPRDVAARVGEPFFTTKPPGQGLGLGVFLARTVADQLKGRLDFDSAPGRGTTVTLRLPLQVPHHVEPA